MCREIVSKRSFIIKYCPDRYETQEIFDKAIDDFLPALIFVADWFVISKMIKKFCGTLFTYDNW